MHRRSFLASAAASAAALALPRAAAAAAPRPDRRLDEEIARRHAESLERIRAWIRQPSIAAENRGMAEGCAFTMDLLRDAGFQRVEKVPTDGQPGVFATLDAGARRTVGVYLMYDVKQADGEWTSPPWEPALVDRPGVGRVLIGRGAVNQKGPQGAFLAALHALRGAGRKPPVNLVVVAEGEEEIGSPHFAQLVRRPEVAAALARSVGVFMPSAAQGPDGVVTVSLGAKGVVELELVASGARWGRGPAKDVHSANRARLDSPAFHLVQALATLVTPEGDPAIEGLTAPARPISEAERGMIAAAARRLDEGLAKKQLGVSRWAGDAGWEEALARLVSRPTVNIQGLVGGYTGPGGKTVLPTRLAAKLDLRLVPDMTREGAVAALKAHLEKRGFGDLEVNVTGGYDPNSTPAGAALVKAQLTTYRGAGLEPLLWPRNAGSWPGWVFTGDPLRLAAGHFGLGHGGDAHAPDEFYLVESANPQLGGLDDAVRSFAAYLQALAA
jgi:acetylornithine deacetylase/succinyl-diaminopimelate desuccinylase-like protein